MPLETIQVVMDARGIASAILARPEKHNAMNAQMIAELTDAARKLEADQKMRIVVLSAQGKTFCAGGDLGWMRDQADKDRAGKMADAGALAIMLGVLECFGETSYRAGARRGLWRGDWPCCGLRYRGGDRELPLCTYGNAPWSDPRNDRPVCRWSYGRGLCLAGIFQFQTL